MLKDLVYSNRTIRKFDGDYFIKKEILLDLVDLARMTPSSMNLQPLKYFITNCKKTNEIICKHLIWAGCQSTWAGPTSTELPTAHIIILRDTKITKHPSCDHGIAAQTIMLGATEKGLGGCMHTGFNKEELYKALKIPEYCQILFILSLGKPKDRIIIEPIKDNNTTYWRDAEGHHVPKRTLDEILILDDCIA